MYLISDDNFVFMYDQNSLKLKNTLVVPLLISDTQDKIEILWITVSRDEQLLGVISGKNCIKEIEEIYSLHVYKFDKTKDEFQLMAERHLNEEFRDFCVQFEF